MTRRRMVIFASAVALIVLAAVVAVLVWPGGEHKATRLGTTPPVATQPAVPPDWHAKTVGPVHVAVPAGWTRTTTGAGGATRAAWWPSAPAKGTLPTRCAVQVRPHWLLTFLPAPGDWAGALRRDLAAMRAVTGQSLGSVDVTNVHPLRVNGAQAALAFTARVRSAASAQAGQTLASADLLAAFANGSEMHVFCSGPADGLPAHLADGVDSATLG